MNSQNSLLKTHGFTVAVILALSLVLGASLVPTILASSLTFTTIDPPGSTFTLALDINASRDIVANYGTADGNGHGFLLSNFTTIDFPDAVSFSTASDINAAGQIVGNYDDAAGNRHGSLLNSGQFTLIDFPGARSTEVLGINAKGEMVGRYALGGQDPFFAGLYVVPRSAADSITLEAQLHRCSEAYVIRARSNRSWIQD